MYSIENDELRAEFNSLGAELVRLYDKKTKEERLWNADPQVWGKHAPVLFPFVGASKNGQYVYDGETYAMGRHGFAREMAFEVIAHDETSIQFELRSTEQTLLKYPFAFVFQVGFALRGNALHTTYTVRNEDAKDMIFSVGGHPAFHCDFLNHDCILEFEKPEKLETIKINLENGLLRRQREDILLSDSQLALTKSTFKDDALVFENLQSAWIKLVDPAFSKVIKVTISDFPSLGIWSPQGPFVCIEPWQGTADYEDTSGSLAEKPGTVTLKPKEAFTKSYLIQLEV